LAALDSDFAEEVALLTNGLAQDRFQAGRVDDRVISIFDDFLTVATPNVELSRPMAALAANGITLEDGKVVPIFRVSDGEGAVAVANQASGPDWPATD
jgi:hypothetical protein